MAAETKTFRYGATNAKMENKMEGVLDYWFHHPTETFEEIAAGSNVGDKTFWRYRQHPEFMEEHKKQLRGKFDALEDKAIAGLEKQIDSENWKAIEFVLKAQGYNGEDKIAVGVKDTVNIVIE